MESDLLNPEVVNNRPRLCFEAFARANLDTLFQRPVNGVVQILNQGLGEGTLPDLKIIPIAPEFEQGSAEWYSSQFGTGSAMLLELLALRAAGRGLATRVGANQLGARLGLVTLEQGSSRIASYSTVGRAAENLSLGFAYEGLFRPVHKDEMHEFWSARLKNATSGGMTLMALGASTQGFQSLGERLVPKGSSIFLSAPRQLAVGASGGFLAGLTNASTRSLLSDGEFGRQDLLASAKNYAAFGAYTFGSGGFLLEPVQKTTLSPETQRQTLMRLASDKGVNEEIRSHIHDFEQRARKDRLNGQEVAATLANVAHFLRRGPAEGVSENDLPKLSVQCLRQAASPRLTDQGYNNTCNVTTIEGRLYSVHPSAAVRMVADLATKGKFNTYDGPVSLKPDQLAPDEQAKKSLLDVSLKDFENGSRPYSSQLFQLGAVNAYWQHADRAPDDQSTERGEIEYQLRATDPTKPSSRVESIVINRPGREPQVLSLNGEAIRSPSLGLTQMLRVERTLTGRVERSQRMIDVFSTKESTADVFKPSSVDDLKSNLAKMKAEGRFPVTLGMDVRQDEFWKKLYGDAPVTVNSFQDTGYHVLQIVDYDGENNKVFVDGSWGTEKDFLDLPGGKPALSAEEVWNMMQDGAAKVTNLYIYNNNNFTDNAVVRAQSWTNLKNATLNNTSLTDVGLSNFANLRHIERFGLAGNQISDVGLRHLKDLSAMKDLDLSRTNVTAASLELIAGYKNLEALNISGTSITPEEFVASAASKNPSLRRLSVSIDGLTQAKVDALKAGVPKDVTLSFELPSKDRSASTHVWTWNDGADKIVGMSATGGDNSGKLLDFAVNCPELRSLSLPSAKIDIADLRKFASIPKLTSLSLSDSKNLTDADFAQIPAMAQLQRLDLSRSKIQSLGAERFQGLTTLTLSGTEVNDASLRNIALLATLSTLDLKGTKVTDACVPYLKNCPQLRSLTMGKTDITTAGAKALLALPGLRDLDLSKTKVSDEFLVGVNTTFIDRLTLTGTAIGDQGVKNLNGNAHVSDLDLNGTQVTSACLDDLATMKKLMMLNLASTKVDDAGLKKLAPLKLNYLNLSGTTVSDDGVDALITLAPAGTLYLIDTKVTMEGLRRLVQSGKIYRIAISYDRFTDEQVKELGRLNPKCGVYRSVLHKD
ncbi:MAG: hypothetical protein K2W95_30390 [Candidatus Obscuribacterales bacterium]|nr:hypothetical protein [Candidatus Obscuribacterales bacterium]